jgi:hypothetical protein
MQKILVTVKVFVPTGEKCEGCRFLDYIENAECYKCSLFNEWELNKGYYSAVRVEDCDKCVECLDVCGMN